MRRRPHSALVLECTSRLPPPLPPPPLTAPPAVESLPHRRGSSLQCAMADVPCVGASGCGVRAYHVLADERQGVGREGGLAAECAADKSPQAQLHLVAKRRALTPEQREHLAVWLHQAHSVPHVCQSRHCNDMCRHQVHLHHTSSLKRADCAHPTQPRVGGHRLGHPTLCKSALYWDHKPIGTGDRTSHRGIARAAVTHTMLQQGCKPQARCTAQVAAAGLAVPELQCSGGPAASHQPAEPPPGAALPPGPTP